MLKIGRVKKYFAAFLCILIGLSTNEITLSSTISILKENPVNKFIKITATAQSSFGIKEDGSLWAWGAYNIINENSNREESNHPRQIIDNGITDVAAAYNHIIVLKKDGSLWAWGNNVNGQIGDGSQVASKIPKKIIDSDVKAIAAGTMYSVAIKNDGSLWTWGNNIYGRLGDGTIIDSYTPKKILISNVKAIAIGGECTYALENDGSLWSWGNNKVGQLGDGTKNDSHIPKKIISNGVKEVYGGGGHAFVIKTDGSLWTWGQNHLGQLGIKTSNSDTNLTPIKTNISNIIMISAGAFHTVGLKNDGSVWTWGDNEYGQLCDGTIDGVGNYVAHPLPQKVISSGVKAIATGWFHTLVLKNDGAVWMWGNNSSGQLGDDSLHNTETPNYPKSNTYSENNAVSIDRIDMSKNNSSSYVDNNISEDSKVLDQSSLPSKNNSIIEDRGIINKDKSNLPFYFLVILILFVATCIIWLIIKYRNKK